MDNNAVIYDNFQPFSMASATPETAANGIDLQIKCLKPEAASFSIDASKFTLTFPENCGLGLIKTNVEKSYTD